jgi:hypothetical protein
MLLGPGYSELDLVSNQWVDFWQIFDTRNVCMCLVPSASGVTSLTERQRCSILRSRILSAVMTLQRCATGISRVYNIYIMRACNGLIWSSLVCMLMPSNQNKGIQTMQSTYQRAAISQTSGQPRPAAASPTAVLRGWPGSLTCRLIMRVFAPPRAAAAKQPAGCALDHH